MWNVPLTTCFQCIEEWKKHKIEKKKKRVCTLLCCSFRVCCPTETDSVQSMCSDWAGQVLPTERLHSFSLSSTVVSMECMDHECDHEFVWDSAKLHPPWFDSIFTGAVEDQNGVKNIYNNGNNRCRGD